MKVLVTGGSGLLGDAVCRQLQQLGHDPSVFDVRPPDVNNEVESIVGDVLDLSGLIQAIRTCRAEVIVHLAGMLTPSVGKSPLRGININYMGTAQVLEAARIESVRRVVLASSNTIYDHGAVPGRPTRETDPIFPRSVYATTKVAAEWTGRNYSSLYGVEFVALRLAALFGPGQSQSGVAGRWIDPLVTGLIREGRAMVAKPTRPQLEYVYVSDAATAFASAASASTLTHAVVNVGEGRLTPFLEILDLLRQLIPKSKIEIDEGANATSPYREATDPMDLSRASEMLHYVPEYPMPRALADYVEKTQKLIRR